MIGTAARIGRAVVAALAFLSVASAALAQDQDAWLRTALTEVRNLQLQPECFAGLQARSIHVLGVAQSAEILDEAGQIEILGQLSALLSRETRLRVTKADTFSFIATSTIDTGPRRQQEITDLMERADRADITLVVQPYRSQGGMVDAEVRLWARGGEEAEVRCTPSFLVSIPVADPRCVDAFERAMGLGTSSALESFLLFFPDCPQAAQAQQAIALKRNVERQTACQDAFTEAVRANTAAAFARFVDEHADCGLAPTATEMLARLEAEEARRAEEARLREEETREARLRAEEEARRRIEAEAAAERRQREIEEAARRQREAEEARLAEIERQRREMERILEIEAAERQRAAQAAERQRAAQEAARQQALLRPPPSQWQPAPSYCYVYDVRPPDDWLALRTQPSSRSGSRLRKLPSGTRLEMLGERSGDWHRVRIDDGTVGWVSWATARWIRC